MFLCYTHTSVNRIGALQIRRLKRSRPNCVYFNAFWILNALRMYTVYPGQISKISMSYLVQGISVTYTHTHAC